MMQKLGERGLWKLGIYFTYLCAQVLILGALMLTTTNMIAHSIMMLLTIVFYFAVCFKDPGTYAANPEPNLEDISNSRKLKSNGIAKGKKKKIVSDQIYNKDLSDIIQNQEREHTKQVESELKPQKKTSMEQKTSILVDKSHQEQKQAQMQKQSQNNTLQVEKSEANNMIVSAKIIFSAAKNAFGNFTNFMSKKNIEPTQHQPNANEKGLQTQQEVKVQPLSERININIFNEKINKEEVNPPQEPNHERQKENQFGSNQKVKARSKASKKTLTEKVLENRRYCRICEFYQPMRVRHCHSCEECISTFDHHCPWLSTCIGQKNKLLFIAYLTMQTLQFFVIFIDLVRYLSESSQANTASVGILLLAVILILIVLILLLSFHIYLALHNLTTWELFRWEKIEYLSLFDKKLLKSPFSKGWKQNLKILWAISMQPDNKKWEQQLSQSLSQFLLKVKFKSDREEGTTQRKMFMSQQNF